MPGTRIVGIGNPDRGDDAVGLVVARALGALGVREPLALLDAWDGAESVVLIDAVVAGASPGTIFDWDIFAMPSEARTLRVSMHGMSVLDSFRLAQALGRAPKHVRVIGIEGASFDAGAPLTPSVAEAVDEVVALLRSQYPTPA